MTENKQDHESRIESTSRNVYNKSITVQIGSNQLSFPIHKLRSLSYFNAMFSQRWLNNRNLKTTTIDIFGDYNSTNDHVTQSKQVETPFQFIHLKCLLKCVEKKQIPSKLPPQLNLLEGLINCNDFLMNKQDCVITVDSLINYFKNVKPRLTIKQKTYLFEKTSNQMLRQALILYNKQFDTKMNEMRLELAKNHSSIQSFSDIKFDDKTAFALLKEKFKIKLRKSASGKRLKIKISNFTNKENYFALLNRCDNSLKSCLSQFDSLIEMIYEIDKSQYIQYPLIMEKEQYYSLCVTLSRAIDNATSKECGMDQVTFNKRLLVACKALWRLSGESGKSWVKPGIAFEKSINKMSSDLVEEFTTLIFETNDKYIGNYNNKNMNKFSDDKRKRKQEALDEYYRLWKLCLLKCSDKWIINNGDLWFGIVNKYDKNSVEWIMNDVVGKMNGEKACDFGIYLTKYIAYEWNSKDKNKFPQKYLDFLRDELGVDWELTYKNNNNVADNQSVATQTIRTIIIE